MDINPSVRATGALSQIQQITAGIQLKAGWGPDPEFTLSWTGRGRQAERYAMSVVPHAPSPKGCYMVGYENGEEISLCQGVEQAIENATGELVHLVLLKEFGWEA